jgi:hypothetical protein
MQDQEHYREMGRWNGCSKPSMTEFEPYWDGAGLQDEIRNGIWDECASNLTLYSNILATRVTKRSPQELLFGKEAN